MNTSKLLGIGLAAFLILISASGFSQVQAAQNRIPEQVVINGQRVNGAYVLAAGGGMQSFTCSNPQQYVTPDGASQGWACYDQVTGVWLLNAVPPATAQAQAPVPVQPQQPTVIYQQPPTVVYQQPPTIIYQQPALVYATPVYPVYVGPVYPPRVVLGVAAINATGRIISAALVGPRYYSTRVYYGGRHYRR